MWAILAPQSKNIKEKELIYFPWEEEEASEFTEKDQQELLDEVEKIKSFYDEFDTKTKTTIEY